MEEKRRLIEKFCVACGLEFKTRRLSKREKVYCNRDCYLNSTDNKAELKCGNCGVEFKRKRKFLSNSRSGIYFCSRSCKDEGQRTEGIKAAQPSHYKNGKTCYRALAFRNYGKRCGRCSYAYDERMLDVDHIDGNRANNKLDNLQVLCVWCHALKTRKVEPHGAIVLIGRTSGSHLES